MSGSASTRKAVITVRVTPEQKERFVAVARSRGLSEAQLALNAICMVLDLSPASPGMPMTPAKEAASDRVTIRLRPGDGEAIAERARAREMKASAYLAALVRAHLATNPPLPAKELAHLKQGIGVLVGLGRLMVRLSHQHTATDPATSKLQDQIELTRRVLTGVERALHNFARAALASWESRRG